VALSIAAVAVAAAVLPSAASADPDSARAQAIADAEANVIRCQAALDAGGLTAAERNEATRCVRINAAALRVLLSSSPSPSTPPATTPPATTTTPPPPTPPPTTLAAGFPNAATTGVPAGWVPTTTRSTDLRVTTAGTIVQDLRLTNGADILVDAPNVTIRRVELLGGRIDLSPGSVCHRTLIERTTFRRPAGTVTDADQEGAITPGGWTAVGIHMDGVTEGLRAGMKSACGANNISDSFLRIQAPDVCADWHGDGIQGYDGGPVTVSNVAITFQERGGCGGTAPFFYPHSQGNSSRAAASASGWACRPRCGGWPLWTGRGGTGRSTSAARRCPRGRRPSSGWTRTTGSPPPCARSRATPTEADDLSGVTRTDGPRSLTRA
jgi:hypothetical protein